MNPFDSLPEYETFLYSLVENYASIQSSTVVVIRRGPKFAIAKGELHFVGGYRLTMQELLTLENDVVTIEFYGYEIWYNDIKLYWYDSQPHPNHPDLAVTHPHHKHVPPDIKRNRIPAPGLSFMQPNLSFLITEIEQTLRL